MPRQRNQAARRAELLDAAVRAINERGPAAVQMKDVAKAAGMAVGSVYYYYDNVDAVLAQVHTLAFDRYYTERAKAIAEYDDAAAKLATMIDLGLPAPGDDPLLLALYQLGIAKARDAGHRSLMTQLCGEQRELYQAVLREGVDAGRFTLALPRQIIAEHLVAMENGYGLAICTEDGDYSHDQVRDLMLQVAAQWTGCPELESAR